MKPKKCKICNEKFTPSKPLQMVCSFQCSIEYSRRQKDKAWKSRKKKIKEDLLTVQDLMKIAQQVFNKFIRERDKGKPCISCGNEINGATNASHYYSAGGHFNVRFDEDNVHSSCVRCNMYLSGNLEEYGRRLPERIGKERFKALQERSQVTRKYTREDLKTITKEYKQKIKEL